MFRIELVTWFVGILVNLLLLLSCFCISDKKKQKLKLEEKEMNALKQKKKNLFNDNLEIKEEDNDTLSFLSIFPKNVQISSYNYYENDETKNEDCIKRSIKSLLKFINKINKKKNRLFNKYIPDIKGNYDGLNKIIEKLETKDEFDYIKEMKENNLIHNIEQKLKTNFEESLIDNEIYKPKWNSKEYLKKFKIFSYDSNHYNNMVTIFVSGFLTENKNSFDKNYENYSFKDNKKSSYYFYLWPSCGSPDEGSNFIENVKEICTSYNGIGCKFEEAYKNAIISGELLSDIIASKSTNFFGESKINLVGHSLGCRVIFNCLKHFSNKYKNLKGIINDVILLAGATTIDDYEFDRMIYNLVGGRFIHCFNKNDIALFISQPFSSSPIGLREIKTYFPSKIENYETDLAHTEYCENLDFILNNINNKNSISFI